MRHLDIMQLRPLVRPHNILEPDNPGAPPSRPMLDYLCHMATDLLARGGRMWYAPTERRTKAIAICIGLRPAASKMIQQLNLDQTPLSVPSCGGVHGCKPRPEAERRDRAESSRSRVRSCG